MSALPPKADIGSTCQDVRFVLIANMVEAGALEVRDISNVPGPRNGNFAIVHAGRVIKDGFANATAAGLYTPSHCASPARDAERARRHRRPIHSPRRCAEILVDPLTREPRLSSVAMFFFV